MRIDPFEMERLQAVHENLVKFNLSESGVSPLSVAELTGEGKGADDLASLKLGYPWSNGSPKLRANIARFYPGATAENVTVTNGGSEANFISFFGLLSKGERAAVMIPNYQQAWGLGRFFGDASDTYELVEGKESWELDASSLKKAVNKKTKLILVTNPNNPTGHVLTEEEMVLLVDAADRVGAWLVVDEIYRGAELAGGTGPTFWGRYDKLLITSGLSKAFGLPGLRIGWVVGPEKTVAKLWAYRDYTTLSPTSVSDQLATIAMAPMERDAIFKRTRKILRAQLPTLERWVASHGGVLSMIRPEAAAIGYVHYRLPVASREFYKRLMSEESVLVTTADLHGQKGKYIRIGYGYDEKELATGLARVSRFIERVQSETRKK
jgi:aspartate/methionine/tyrosine aminotransferase